MDEVARQPGRQVQWQQRLGTLLIQDELKYKGTPYQCSTGRLTWTATLQG